MKLAWGLQVTYCYHDLIYMIKNNLCYNLYESDNGWGKGLGAKDPKDADVCTLAEILKKEEDDEDGESEEEKEEEEEEENNNDDETEAADELLKNLFINEFFPK